VVALTCFERLLEAKLALTLQQTTRLSPNARRRAQFAACRCVLVD
jgi:hypothetical protein